MSSTLPALLEPVDLRPNETDDFVDSQGELLTAFQASRRLLQTARDPQGIFTGVDVERVWQLWQRYFAVGSVVYNPEAPVAWGATDVGFLALCRAWSRACDDEPTVDLLWHSWVHLVVIACQHTQEARVYWPDDADWRRLKQDVAQVVAWYVDTGPQKRTRLLQQLDVQTAAENDESRVDESDQRRAAPRVRPLPTRLQQLHQERFLPASVKATQEKERKEAERKLEMGARYEDVRVEASEEAKGALWRHSPLELVRNYVRLASRTVYKVERDRQLVRHYEHREAPQFQAHVYQRARDFVAAKCRVEMSDACSKLFRDLCNEWCHPLGAETDAWRHLQTRSDVSGAQAVLRNEVGIDITQDLHVRTMVPPARIAPDDLLWPALFVVLVHYDLLQASGIDFLATYVLAQSHTRAARQRIQAQWHKSRERLPLVLLAERRWWVHRFVYGSRREDERAFWMYACDSLLHAVCVWLWVVSTSEVHRACDENGRSVRSLAERLLGDLATCLRVHA